MKKNILNCLTTTLCFFFVFSVAGTKAARIVVPPEIFYYQPAASVFGSEAAWVNPAGLGRYNASSFQLMTSYSNDKLARSWGMVTSRERFAVAYRSVYNPDGEDLNEYVFALGSDFGGRTYIGGSYRYFKNGPPELHKKHLWNIGVMGGRSNLRWAAVFENLNRSRNLNNDRTETEMRYSIAYRPSGPRLTLSVDMFLSTGTRLSNADFVYHAELASNNGIYLRGYLDSDKNFQAGFRINLLKYFGGVQANFTNNSDHRFTDLYVGATSLRQPSIIPEKGRRLSLDISGSLSENPPNPVFGPKRIPFALVIIDIYRAAEDPSIKEMLINLRGLSLGFGQAQELRHALETFKSKGKKVTCHLSRAGNISYYVASVADQILISPVDQLRLVGLKAELMFIAGSLDKLGIRADIMQVGTHKTAAERLTRTSSSEANREQVNQILDELFDQLVTTVAEGRNLSADSVRRLIDNGPFNSQQALECGLVDGLSYRDDMDHDFLNPMPQISFKRYMTDTLLDDGWPEKPVLAVVVAEGEISSSRGENPLRRNGAVTPALMRKGFAQALHHPDVAGVVLRINSPGGLALAGEEIYHVTENAAERKPLTVSMANVAASGGYYIAMKSRRIFADPGSITGSIGIFGGKPDLSGLYDKIALGAEIYTRGRYAGMLSTMRPFSDDEREKYLSQLQSFYSHFLDLVAENRGLSVDSVDLLAQGRVWTGREAADNGLVDELGGLKQALDFAAEQASVDDYRVAVFPQVRPWIILPGRSLFQTVAGFITGRSDRVEKAVDDLPMLTEEGIYARMPYDLYIE